MKIKNLLKLASRKAKISMIPVDVISARLIVDPLEGKEEKVAIVDSPHYKHLLGEREPYREYYERIVLATHKKRKHAPEAFDELASKFSFLRSLLIVVTSDDIGGFIIHDGLHRCALYKYHGIRKVPCLVLRRDP